MANLKRQGRIEWRVAAILLSALLLVVSGPDSRAAPDPRREDGSVHRRGKYRFTAARLLRRVFPSHVEPRAEVYAGRPFFSRGVRRVIPQSFLADLRLLARDTPGRLGDPRPQDARQPLGIPAAGPGGLGRSRAFLGGEPHGERVPAPPPQYPGSPAATRADPRHHRRPALGERHQLGLVRGGWADAVSGHADSTFQYHHQPFAYFAAYGSDTPGRAEHLKDENEFLRAIDANTLPSVVFWKPLGRDDEH